MPASPYGRDVVCNCQGSCDTADIPAQVSGGAQVSFGEHSQKPKSCVNYDYILLCDARVMPVTLYYDDMEIIF